MDILLALLIGFAGGWYGNEFTHEDPAPIVTVVESADFVVELPAFPEIKTVEYKKLCKVTTAFGLMLTEYKECEVENVVLIADDIDEIVNNHEALKGYKYYFENIFPKVLEEFNSKN